ncbi:hypothetical protein Tco_0788305 [Tanacetum coccineum]
MTTTTARKTTTTGSKTLKQSASQSAPVEETMQTIDVFEAPLHTGPNRKLEADLNHEKDGQYPHDLRQPLPLVPNSQGRHVIPFHHFINNDLEYLRGGVSSRKSEIRTNSPSGISHIGAKSEGQFYAFANLKEAARGRLLNKDGLLLDDDVLYKFKEGDFHRLRIQDIEDYAAYSLQDNDNTQRGRKHGHLNKKNRLMRINELHKFSDGTLDDVWTALNDRLKGIRMEYLPQTFWSQRDKANARDMI